MIKTRTRKILGDVWARKGRTFLVSLAIFIGVAGTIALFSMRDAIVSQLEEDIKEDELAMLEVFMSLTEDRELDNEAYLERLRSINGVTEVVGGVSSFGRYSFVEGSDEFDQGNFIGYSEPFDALPIEPMRLLEGEYPAAGAKEVAIDQRMADDFEVGIGDTVFIKVLSPSEETGEVGTVEAWTISAIMLHAYAEAPTNTLYTSPENINYISAVPGYNTFAARFVDFGTAEAQQEVFAEVIAEETPYIPTFIFAEDPAANGLLTAANQIGNTMSFLAVVALLVSGFLVVNVISSIVIEQKRQIGVMKSIGATQGDNFFIYSGIAFTYGVIGVIPGVLVGIPGGSAAAHGLAPSLNTVLDGFQISPPSIFIGVLIGLLVPVLASIIPVFFGTRVQILDAMTDLGIDANYGAGPIARFIGLLPIPITIRQGLSNVSIKKSRLFFTVITLSVAVGAFMGIFAVFSNLTSGLGIFLDTFNVEVGVFQNGTESPERVISVLSENFQDENREGVKLESIEPGFQLQVEFEGYEPPPSSGGPPGIFAYGFNVFSETPAFRFELDDGVGFTEENVETGVVFSSNLATNMEKTLGDIVVMKVPGRTVELEIVGISDFPLDQIWIDWRTLATAAGYTVGAPTPNEYLTTVTLNGAEVTTIGLDTQLRSILEFTEGAFFTPNEAGIIISTPVAESTDVAVGDSVELTTADGNVGTFTVSGIFDLDPMLAEQLGEDQLIGVFWQELATLEGISIDGEPRPQGYFVITDIDDPSVRDIDRISDEIEEVMLAEGISVTNFNFVDLVEQINSGFLIFQIILQAVAFLIGLVGALGLLTTLSMSVFERQKEIGVMRSIGAGSGTVALQFLTEGLVVGFIAWLVGLPLGYLIMVGLLNVTGLSETFAAEFPPQAAAFGFFFIMVIATIASLWPSFSASRKTVSDILRYQ